jgi:C-terminal processing protease CtpA/Prc
MRAFPRWAAVLLLALCGLAAARGEGWIGIGLDVDTGGSFWHPRVQSAKVSSIAADSPAAKQAIAVGDSLVEIAGLPVAGGDGNALLGKMRTTAGDSVHLKLQRADGTIYERDVVAVPPPQQVSP